MAKTKLKNKNLTEQELTTVQSDYPILIPTNIATGGARIRKAINIPGELSVKNIASLTKAAKSGDKAAACTLIEDLEQKDLNYTTAKNAVLNAVLAFQMGYSLDTVNVLIDRFQNKYGVIIYSDETQEIAILNYLKYSIIKGGKPVLDCIEKDIGQVKDKTLLGFVYGKVSCFEDARETMVAIKEKLSVYDIYNDNDNDSNVPRNVPRIVTESPKSHKKESNKTDEFVSLIDESSLSDPLKESMKVWLAYKTERKESYKPTGFKSLLTMVTNRVEQYGETLVIGLINESMSKKFG